MIYLAIPYTWNPNKSFEIVNKVAAKMMSGGTIVFSPISHSHPIADHLPPELRTDQEFWMRQDLAALKRCDYLVVCVIDGNETMLANSKGVQTEMAFAKEHDIPIIFKQVKS